METSTVHKIIETVNKPSIETFVDDNFVTIKKDNQQYIKTTCLQTNWL